MVVSVVAVVVVISDVVFERKMPYNYLQLCYYQVSEMLLLLLLLLLLEMVALFLEVLLLLLKVLLMLLEVLILLFWTYF